MIEDDNEFGLGFDDDGPKPMTLANAIQVWSLNHPAGVTTVEMAAAVFHTTEAKVRQAVEMHYWMFLTGAAGDEIEHEGE